MRNPVVLALVLFLTCSAAAAAEGEATRLPEEAIDAMLQKRIENQARWADYTAEVTTRLLVDGEVELKMVHRATFDLDGRATLELVREEPVKGGIFTRSIRNKKRRELEDWRDKLQGVLNFYWAVSAGQAREWMKRATVREVSSETVTEYLVEGNDYAIPGDQLTVVRRDGQSLPDAFRVKTLVKDRHVELMLNTLELGESGVKVPSQASVDVAEERLRLVLRYEKFQRR